MADLTGNLLVLQTGLPTAVGNNTLCGVIEEAGRHDSIEEIYGAPAGVTGLLAGSLLDLGEEKRKTIEGLRRTPGSALGTSAARLSASDATNAVAVLRANNVRFVLMIGGSEAIESARTLEATSQSANYEISVLAIPQSATNDLPETDHCPGYGSAARWVASATREAALEARARKAESPVLILQVLGSATGWLAAAAALSSEGGAGPQLIHFPERAVAPEQFVDSVQSALQQHGYCLAVITEESVRDAAGQAACLGALTAQIHERLQVGCAVSAPGALQRLSHLCASRLDADEAFAVGQTAARQVVSNSGYAVTLKREAGGSYKSIPGTARLDTFPLEPRALPAEFINDEGTGVTEAFMEYARPLIGGPLAEYVALDAIAVSPDD